MEVLVLEYVPSLGAAAMQIFPVNPISVAVISAVTKDAITANTIKNFLFIIVYPDTYRAQLLSLLFTFYDANWREVTHKWNFFQHIL